jgi:flagellar motor switch protein FliM
MEPALASEAFRMLREKARAKTSAVCAPSEASSVSPFDPRQSGQLSPGQRQAVEALHKSFASHLVDGVGNLLRTTLQVDLAAVEQTSGAEFLKRTPEPASLVFFRSTLGPSAIMHFDLPLLFPLLDLILGGPGTDSTEVRDLTDIERQLVEPLDRVIARSLRDAWEPLLQVGFDFDRRCPQADAAAQFSPADRLLLIAFELRWQQTQARLQLAFPAVLSSALLRKLTPQEAPARSAPAQDRGRLREQLLTSQFLVELLLPRSTVSVRQLYGLRPGDVLLLPLRSNEPLTVQVSGQNMFLASAVRSGARRGAQVQKILSIIPEKEGQETK